MMKSSGSLKSDLNCVFNLDVRKLSAIFQKVPGYTTYNNTVVALSD